MINKMYPEVTAYIVGLCETDILGNSYLAYRYLAFCQFGFQWPLEDDWKRIMSFHEDMVEYHENGL